jgi:LPXTG-site transpeptidase (sortase) family protein
VAALTSRFVHIFILFNLLPTLLGARAGFMDVQTTASGDVSWNTFLGSPAYEEVDDIAIDGNGNIYVIGYGDRNWGNPRRPFTATPDAWVAKVDAQGTLQWNTFLGGDTSDLGYGIALDGNGNVYVAGNSHSTWGNPIQPFTPGTSDVFVARLDPNGNLIWNTFLGGAGMDQAREIAVRGGSLYVTGRSDTAWGLVTARPYAGSMDGFVARLDVNGNFAWNSFLGGNEFDEAWGIATDGTGAILVSGFSTGRPGFSGSWGNPIRPYTAFRDAFLAKLDSAGALVWNTFLGGGGNDEGLKLAVDGSGGTFVAGYSTATWENPLRGYTANEDAFVAKVNANGSFAWNTFLGGGSSDSASGIDIDGIGNLYVTGSSSASWGSPIRPFSAGNDAFAFQLGPNGELMWNTFLGGNMQDYGYGIDVDSDGNVVVVGPGNSTWGNPIRAYTAEMDAFVVKLGSPPVVISTSLKPTLNPGPASFTLTFNKDVNNPQGNTTPDDTTNPNNYLLIDKGANGRVDTTSCVNGLVADDKQVTVTAVAYSPTSFTSTVTLAGIMPEGKYRLFVCGTTSIVDLSGNALAGNGIESGTDYTFDFVVNSAAAPASTPTTTSLPQTGFAPKVETLLPAQAADKDYSSLGDVWLEIPSLGLKTSIVGVPQTDQGWDVTWLGDNSGWLNGTAFPTWEGNSVLTGHVYNANGVPGPFFNIKNLKYGDEIIVHFSGEMYIFQVQSTRLLSPTSTDFAFKHLENHSYLTLITCQGYNPLNDSYLFRRIVRAVLVDVTLE